MFAKHVIKHLSAYHHDELSAEERTTVERHLQECRKCRASYEEIRFGARLASVLMPSKAPEGIRNANFGIGISDAEIPTRKSEIRIPVLAAGVAVTMLLGLTFFLTRFIPEGPSWEVTTLRGGANVERLRTGETLETDASSQVQVEIADIGNLVIDPNSRIRLLVTRPDEHRIALDRGKIEAKTIAPPRLFIVETPAATAVDLGCEYTLEVEDDGGSVLHVTLGLVALEREGRETLVPAGAFCRTRAGSGPGTPYYEDASEQFQTALEYLDTMTAGGDRAQHLETVLQESRGRDALSLFHLLPRVDTPSRGLLFDKLAQIFTPPPGVTRDGIGRLDPAMMNAWKAVISQLWQ